MQKYFKKQHCNASTFSKNKAKDMLLHCFVPLHHHLETIKTPKGDDRADYYIILLYYILGEYIERIVCGCRLVE